MIAPDSTFLKLNILNNIITDIPKICWVEMKLNKIG